MNIDDIYERDIRILKEAIGASLELTNLKPFVGTPQMEAADRIAKHLHSIAEIMKESIDE
jgi:hypothetical protein